MPRFIKKMLLLCTLLTVVVLVLNFVGVRAGNIYKDGSALVCEKKRQLIQSGTIPYYKDRQNVLFMGTSRIMAGIIPRYFDELSKEKTFSYNLAFPALTINAGYFALKEYLLTNPPPQCIVLALEISRCRNCSTINYYAVQGMTRVDEIISLFKYSNTKSVLLNYLFPFRMYKFFVPKYLKDSISNPQYIKDLEKRNRAKLAQMLNDRGYYYIEEQAVAEDGQLPDDFIKLGRKVKGPKKPIEYNPYDDPYTAMFFDLAAEHGIPVLMIQPVYRVNQYSQYEKMPPQFENVLKHYGNVTTAPEGWKIKFFENKYFSDPTHLNPEGARIFTEMIFKEYQGAFL